MSLLHQEDDNELEAPEREVTLSTGALVGIFAGLVLLCALFFGLGYTVRGRQTPTPVIAAATTAENSPASQANFNTFKPAAGSPVAGAPRPSPETIAATSAVRPAEQPAAEPPPAAAETAPAAPKEAAPLVKPAAPSHPVPAQPSTAVAPIPEGSFIVQVAAVSHPEDAQYVVAALKAKGYPAAARSEPQDKLLHIQVGPYSNRKDAEAMKQRLASDGYLNPIIK